MRSGYSAGMTCDPRQDMASALAGVGIVVDELGKARGRRRLAETRAARTPEALTAMRNLLGRPTS